MKQIIENKWYQKPTGPDPSDYLKGAVLLLTYKGGVGTHEERSILVQNNGTQFNLLPAKTPWWADKTCHFLITPELNLYVAISSSEAILLASEYWFTSEPFVV